MRYLQPLVTSKRTLDKHTPRDFRRRLAASILHRRNAGTVYTAEWKRAVRFVGAAINLHVMHTGRRGSMAVQSCGDRLTDDVFANMMATLRRSRCLPVGRAVNPIPQLDHDR